jgi:glucose-1-phosphate thymidylyltransferase
MIRKGIILAGGVGSRMSPLTKAVNKQLLPIYDKPLIYYPLSILMLSGIRDILIIVNKGQISQFSKILNDGSNIGIKITFLEQEKPGGLPEAFIIGKDFIGKDNVALILGDNFFYGQSLTKKLLDSTKLKKGARIFLYPVKNPNLYGVAMLKNKRIVKIIEKPKITSSNLAVTGLYFFDNNVIKYSELLKPSKRGELEITDLLNRYLKNNKLNVEFIGRGSTWLDTGSIEDFYNASNFVSAVENRQGLKIACLEEISLQKKWITRNNLLNAIEFYGKCAYAEYLKKFL